MLLRCAALAFGLLLATLPARADDAADAARMQAFLGSLHYQAGRVALPQAQASLDVRPGFRFLGHDDSRRVLEEFWGNPPDDDVIGMLVPDSANLASDHSWAVVVTYSDDGYVSDEDAAKIDFDELLGQMQQDTRDGNAERKDAGYGSVELVGWAQPPSYDSASKRIHWAKELAFEGEDGHTVNYDIRVLGRSGYLSLNAVASAADLGLVREGMTQVLPMAQFDPGQRYADFQPGHDKAAAYGIAALVGGGLAAKAGLFAKLGAFLLAAKKLVVLVIAGLVAVVGRIFGRKGKDKTAV